jgi:TonB family protein
MRVLSTKNTVWRDSYDRIRRWSLLVAVGLHAIILLALPRVIADRLHEALIPSPNVFVIPGGPGSELEVVALQPPSEEVAETQPEPEPVEEVVEVEIAEVPIEETVADPEAAPSEGEGRDDGEPEGGVRGSTIHLLVEVLADGSVGEVRIEKGSRFAVLDTAALAAAKQMLYVPAQRGGGGVVQWTRAEMRF